MKPLTLCAIAEKYVGATDAHATSAIMMLPDSRKTGGLVCVRR